jgi:hypothetical protein
MQEVLYLSYSNQQDGLIFPNELEKGIYSPGMWIIQATSINECSSEFFFNAVENNEIAKLTIRRVSNSNYQVDTLKYGKINLRLVEIYWRYQNYVGNSQLIDRNLKFFQLVPIDIPKITRLCLEEKFFLIGKIDEDIN